MSTTALPQTLEEVKRDFVFPGHSSPPIDQEQLRRMQEEQSRAWGCEAEVTERIERIIKDSTQTKEDEKYSQFKQIDMGFLRSRDAKGYPAFVIMQIANERALFTTWGDEAIWTNLPYINARQSESIVREIRTILDPIFADVMNKMRKNAIWRVIKGKSRSKISIYQRFKGVIPFEIKKECLTGRLFDPTSLFLVFESTGWKTSVKTESIPMLVDPLIIGYAKTTGKFYLLADFDTTTAEEYVKKEFTVD
tara:strand:+ start:2336 stop:3085 length:750 start_codon:yes stop_codon:yes gene_type:complete